PRPAERWLAGRLDHRRDAHSTQRLPSAEAPPRLDRFVRASDVRASYWSVCSREAATVLCGADAGVVGTLASRSCVGHDSPISTPLSRKRKRNPERRGAPRSQTELAQRAPRAGGAESLGAEAAAAGGRDTGTILYNAARMRDWPTGRARGRAQLNN